MIIKDGMGFPEGTSSHVIDQLLGTNWEGIEELEEHAGYLLFPEKIYKRNKKGLWDETSVMIRVPRQHELRKARLMARGKAKEEGLDAELDRDQIDEYENICILWHALRMPTPPHDPLVLDPSELEKKYDKKVLSQMFAKMDAYSQVLDPQPNTISKEELFALIALLAKEKSILPLHVYGSEVQNTCVVSMAEMLMNSQELKSLSAPSEP